MDTEALRAIAYAPYETIEHPTREDWKAATTARPAAGSRRAPPCT